MQACAPLHPALGYESVVPIGGGSPLGTSLRLGPYADRP